MKKKIAGIFVAATVILTLAAGCGETPFSPTPIENPPLPPGNGATTNFGLVEVTISGIGTKQMSARAVPLTPKTAFNLSSPVNTTNTALSFDGVDDYITANSVAADIGSSTAFTLEAWVYPKTATGAGEAILGFHTAAGDNRNILFYNPDNNSFSYYDPSVGFVSTPGSVSAGNWYHVAVTIDASNQGRLYINGQEEVTFTTTVRPDAGGLFSIGQEYDGSSPGNFFNGRIDEARIWNSARSQTQIQTNMDAILTPPVTGLASYYQFNETTGTTASDAAGDNDGTLYGNPTWEVTGPVLEGTFSGGDGTIQIEPITHGSFTYGERGNGGMRYVFATFKVRNAQLDGTAYNTPRQNLTFLAVDTDQTYSNTAVYSLRLFNGDPVSDAAAEAIADSVIPTGNAGLVSHTEIESLQPDVLQAYTETEVQNMEDKLPSSSSITDIFPYGFVTRSTGVTPGSRTLPTNPGPSQFDGLVTFAFKLPLQAQNNKDPFEITMLFLPIDDSETRITESPEEQVPKAGRPLWDRVNELAGASVTLLGNSSTSIRGHEVRRLCNVRTAGTASSPVTMLADIGAPCGAINPLPDNVILVNADAPQQGDGFTWATAFNDLQDALYAVRSHADLGEPYEQITEIWVAEGVYYPDEGLNVTNDKREESFHLVEGIKLYGGFTGSEYLRSQRDPYARVTILSGDMTQNDSNSDGNHISESINDLIGANTEHVVSAGRGPSITRATLLDGFIITAGFNLSGGAGFECFAIRRDTECSPVFRNVTFSGNRGKFGGAVYIISEGFSAQASPLFVDVRFMGNWAGFGGAVYNEAEDFNSKANPVFVRTVFSENTAAQSGGAVANYIRTSGYATEAFIYFYNCKFEGNEAIYNFGNGSSIGRGGALYSEYGQFVILNSTIEDNLANIDGGAIYCSYNSTTACLHLYNVTVANNTTNEASGKVIVSRAPIKLDNVIIWGNTPSDITSSASGYANNSIIEGGCPPNVTCTDVLNQDPLFVGGLQLSGLSPAVDAGNNSFVSSNDPYDMDNDGNTSENLPDLNGNPRIVDSDNNGTAIVDMGAYEVQ